MNNLRDIFVENLRSLDPKKKYTLYFIVVFDNTYLQIF